MGLGQQRLGEGFGLGAKRLDALGLDCRRKLVPADVEIRDPKSRLVLRIERGFDAVSATAGKKPRDFKLCPFEPLAGGFRLDQPCNVFREDGLRLTSKRQVLFERDFMATPLNP